jgi:hypothetical protein
MTKTDFIREQAYIKMFTKLILQLKPDQNISKECKKNP